MFHAEIFNSEIYESFAVEDEMSVKIKTYGIDCPNLYNNPLEMRQCRRPISGYFLINKMSEIGNIGSPQLLGTCRYRVVLWSSGWAISTMYKEWTPLSGLISKCIGTCNIGVRARGWVCRG